MMKEMKLTKYQIEVIKELFFPKNTLNSHKLNLIIDYLFKGKSCLTDEKNVEVLTSIGGVGNFICYTHIENGVGVVKITLEEGFFNSQFFQEVMQNYYNEKIKETEKLQQENKEISILLK